MEVQSVVFSTSRSSAGHSYGSILDTERVCAAPIYRRRAGTAPCENLATLAAPRWSGPDAVSLRVSVDKRRRGCEPPSQ